MKVFPTLWHLPIGTVNRPAPQRESEFSYGVFEDSNEIKIFLKGFIFILVTVESLINQLVLKILFYMPLLFS